MTIKEWLTPDLFAVVVILATIVTNLTIYGVVSNYTVDGKISPKVQLGTYTTGVAMTAIYGFLILLFLIGAIDNRPTLYPNKYDFLLMGSDRAFGSIVVGSIIGTVFAASRKEDNTKLRNILATAALICEGLIGAGVVLWLISQE